jgi:ubiquinone/menaquinone biosynthesis C-methylase UbiE
VERTVSRREEGAAFDETRAASYYDSIAEQYDSQLARSKQNQSIRDHFLARVTARVRSGARIVDFGCGTGIDAAWYADRGYTVVGYDISHGMIDVARHRCGAQVDDERVVFVSGQSSELWAALNDGEDADAIVANFAVFNHVHDLKELFRSAAAHLVSGGLVITQMLNPFYWRDVRRFWWWRSAVTSFASGAVVFRGPDTTTYRHFPRFVVQAADGFSLDELAWSAESGAASWPSRAVPPVTSTFCTFVFRRR